ncbi:acyltransferase [Sphingomonas daechungensis]|uniref:acyltransferase family protein n=1 Tax=Sphingomonas daechungensis TaxID=1176646 RepID=UPI0031E9904F
MLRGVAATMVVFVHIGLQLERLGYGTLDVNWLSSGVDIFFVISGFIMWVSVERRQGMSAGDFMRNRIIRIVPLYWLVTAGVLAIALTAPQLLKTTVFSAPHAIASFLFLPARHPVVTDQFWPLLVPGWTLNYEMLFYVLFAIAIAASRGSWRKRFALIAVFLTAVVLAGSALRGRIDVMNFYANPIIFEFLSGVVLGIIYMRHQFARSWTWLLAVAAGFIILRDGSILPFLGHASNLVGATLVVGGALYSRTLPIPGLKAVGDASYSLYLTHVITLAALAHFWRSGGLESLGPTAFTAVGVTVSILGAMLCYRLLERPMTQGLRRFWRTSPRKHLPAA